MKIKFVHRAYNYFWAAALIILIKGCIEYLIYGPETLDINIHDTYIVMQNIHVTIFNALLLAGIGGIYRIAYWAKLPLNQKLIKMHTALSFLPFIIIWIITPVVLAFAGKLNFSWYADGNTWIFLCILLFIAAQLILAVNYTIALTRHFINGKRAV